VATSLAVTAAALAGTLLPACATNGDERLVVFAASSLTDPFAVLEAGFEAAHPGVDVVVSYEGSSALAAQVLQGAPADVFASADQANMQRVAGEAAGTPTVFAQNRLTIAVAPGNPRRVTGLDDLARPDLVVVLAAPEVPAGRYAGQLLEAAGVTVAAASYEQNVRAVAAKVALGEADAGIVYATDVAAQPDRLDAVTIPIESNAVAEYPIVALTSSPLAADFVDYVHGPDGRAALTAAGFQVP
jgi:molybdate transport system substrate-binding protein